MLSKRKSKNLTKNLFAAPPSGNQSTRQLVRIHGLARDPPSLIYPIYLRPPSSYSNKVSRNRVLSSSSDPTICPFDFAKPHRLLLANPQSFLCSKTLSTLWIRVGCVWVQISSQGMTIGKGWRRGYNVIREILAKLTTWHDSSASSHVLLTFLFHGNPSHELLTS